MEKVISTGRRSKKIRGRRNIERDERGNNERERRGRRRRIKKNRHIHLREIFSSSFAFRRVKLAMIQRNIRIEVKGFAVVGG